MSRFQVRSFCSSYDGEAAWMVVEVLMNDGEGNGVSDIYAEFPFTPAGEESAKSAAFALNFEHEEEVYGHWG